ncbi:hypothetical protein DDD_0285 [Nonlabens dokdonensis DSW-6]|uniref:Uncharacterized protein n=1 Tax=Nonlabens dokdonensis (strain DSM 17205 / KCTC 12402 / DSW-6) TaxID=592029 RepID=L7W5F5_NONDD|nr:hypothetical protein DDD_0285 [Nonlabens dokdonensis DSW-6]
MLRYYSTFNCTSSIFSMEDFFMDGFKSLMLVQVFAFAKAE